MSTSNYPSRKHKPDNSKGTTQNRDVNAASRVSLAIKLRAQGLEWDEVAAQAGYGSKGAAHHAVHRELSRTITANVEEMRREEAAILAQLHARCMKAAMDPKNKGFLFAVDRVLAVRERFSKLYGLDVPVEVAANNNLVVIREVPANYLGLSETKSL